MSKTLRSFHGWWKPYNNECGCGMKEPLCHQWSHKIFPLDHLQQVLLLQVTKYGCHRWPPQGTVKTLHSTIIGLILYSRYVCTINPCSNCPIKIIPTMSAHQRMCDPQSLIAANHHHDHYLSSYLLHCCVANAIENIYTYPPIC